MITELKIHSLPVITEVGGKAYNLTKMMLAGLNVPDGFVLGVSFFSPWLDQLKTTVEWRAFLEASDPDLATACDHLKNKAQSFSFTNEQLQALGTFTANLKTDSLFAVRSSSPEEDLEGASFAGAYESALGVTTAKLEATIKVIFFSCLDYRITVYKRNRGFSTDQPKIAVIVQKQIPSDRAGVAFSLNPLTNNYDEAVINANWGQGETVVSGTATPDTFIVDKISLKTKSKLLGAKEISLFLQPGGGTITRTADSTRFCLDDDDIVQICRELQKVEDYYHQHMDIEWAIEGKTVYLVQARPVTTHHQLPPAMTSTAGEKKMLFFDVTVSVQGIFEPLSVLGTSTLKEIFNTLRNTMTGFKADAKAERSLLLVTRGRIYINIGNVSRLAGFRKVASFLGQMDLLMQEVFKSLDLDTFNTFSINKIKLIAGIIPRSGKIVFRIFRSLRKPEAARDHWHQNWRLYQSKITEIECSDLPFNRYFEAMTTSLVRFVFWDTMHLFPAAKVAGILARRLFRNPTPRTKELISMLDLSLPGNVTVEMGHELYNLRHYISEVKITSLEEFKTGIASRSLPPEFLSHWKRLLNTYGHRGQKEIDVASPRFRDNPDLLLQQLQSFLQMDRTKPSPIEHYRISQRERETAAAALANMLPGRKRKSFERYYTTLKTLGGFRETHKFSVVYAIDRLRQRMLKEAKKLHQAGRIDAETDVFFLSLQQLEEVIENITVDVRPLIRVGREEHATDSQCKHVSSLVDSRGKFYRPEPRPARDGEIAGQGLSAGIAKGPVKVLLRPDEKPILPGDILVARATDPAWTPLFVNAAAVILEIGGPLQHGALVAREYGKPCVSGVLDATQQFKDGDLVSVDGNTGIITRL